MPRPCNHPDDQLPQPGEPWTSDVCRVCWLFQNSPDYRRLYDQPAPKPHDRYAAAQRIQHALAKPKALSAPPTPKGCGCNKPKGTA